jgi:hypothetical protein
MWTVNSRAAVPTPPRSWLSPSTGHWSPMARGWFGSEVPGRAPFAAALPLTTVSWPICQVSPVWVVPASTTDPQEAWSLCSASTVGVSGVKVSAVVASSCCRAQRTRCALSPCAHSAEMSRYTLTWCVPPSALTAFTVT